ncbi:MAG: iron ABC transporter permease [Thermoplasmata archaeon]|nr:iron ABC transporter permease [Thermoplasmata archaeon]
MSAAADAVDAASPHSRPPHPGRWRSALAITLLGVALVLLSPLVGSVPIPPTEVFRIILHQLSGGAVYAQPCAGVTDSAPLCSAYVEIVWDERLPVLLLALLAGAALGISGATLQGVFRNPLADPYLLGLSSGGALGAAFVYVFRIGEAEASLVLPVLAFAGSLGAGVAILLAARGRSGSVETLLLTGVALASFLSATLTIVLLYNPTGSLQVSFWLLGGVGGATWNRDGVAFGGILIASTLLVLHGRELNVMQLGNDVAQSIGVPTARLRQRLILLASLVTAMAVAFTGVVGFVGLVAPHIVRRTVSSDYRVVLPLSAMTGGLFLLAANDLAVTVLPGTQLPVGIFTSFAGAPFFLTLLYRRRQASTMGDS